MFDHIKKNRPRVAVMRKIGFTVWFTGLPSAGKSTLARLLQETLDEAGLSVVILDGDEVRQRLTKGLGFTKKDREENIRRIAYVSKLLTQVGAIAIVAAISPYQKSRDHARAEIGNFIEVYVECPLQTCMERDVKGLFAKAQKGEIQNFTGISDPYEPPIAPDISVRTDIDSPMDIIRTIVDYLVSHNILSESLISQVFKEDTDLTLEGRTESTTTNQWAI